MPEDVMEGIFMVGLIFGLLLEPHNARYWLPFAVLTRVGWHGLLRPGEVVAVVSHGVATCGGRVRKVRTGGVVMIEEPKNRRAMGRRQFTTISDDLSLRWLEWLLRELPRGVRLFPGSPQKFRDLLEQSLTILGLQGLGFTLGSLRSGGATAFFLATKNVPALRITGRWSNERSLEVYVQEAMCALICTQVDGAAEMLDALRSFLPLASFPPPSPWWALFSRRAQLSALLRVARDQVRRRQRLEEAVGFQA
jgi:hypothetical protein